MQHIPGLFITISEGKGLGVFTSLPLNKNDIVEVCPIIIIPSKEIPLIDKTILYNYYFNWSQPKGSACIALGYGSIYNHSFHPNAEVISDTDSDTISIKCIQLIEAGGEILIDYCGGIKNTNELWFHPI